MMIKFIIIIFIVKFVLSMRPSDICVINKGQCYLDKNISNKVKCLDFSCKTTKLPYKCDNGYCSLDETTCKHFQNIKNYVKSYYKTISSLDTQIFYEIFLTKIKQCPVNLVTWNKGDVCLREKSCLEKRIIPLRSGIMNLVKKSYCPCPDSYKYDCGNQVCAVNSLSCAGIKLFLQMKSDQKTANIDIKSCNHRKF